MGIEGFEPPSIGFFKKMLEPITLAGLCYIPIKTFRSRRNIDQMEMYPKGRREGDQYEDDQRLQPRRGVYRDPPATPLFGNKSGGTGTARRIEHEVAGICGHQHATLNGLGWGLHNVDL